MIGAAVIVLYGSCQYLAGRSGEVVDQHRQFAGFKERRAAGGVGVIRLPVAVPW